MNKQKAIEKLQSNAVNHYYETNGWSENFEIIGNIYENPALIKKHK